MPNWCNNYLELEHDDPAMITRAKTAFADAKLLAEFVPVPEDLSIVAGRVGADEDQKQKDLVAQEEVNVAKHGYRNWYDYCVNEWGTKWDVGGEGDQATVESPNAIKMNLIQPGHHPLRPWRSSKTWASRSSWCIGNQACATAVSTTRTVMTTWTTVI